MKKIVLALIVCLWACQGEAAAAYDSSGYNTNGGSGSIPSFNVTVVTASKVACSVSVYLSQPTLTTITSITVGGVAASHFTAADSPATSPQVQEYVAALGDVSGAKAVVVTLGGDNTWDSRAIVLCGNGVDQTTPATNGAQSNTGFSSGTEALSISNGSGDLTVDFMLDAAGNAITFLDGATQRELHTLFGAATQAGTGSANVHRWTVNGGDTCRHSGMAFKAAAGGGVTARPCIIGGGLICDEDQSGGEVAAPVSTFPGKPHD